MPDEKPQLEENLRWEYREVAAAHRFYVGLRFIIAAFTATFQPALLRFYTDAVIPNPQMPAIVIRGYWFTLGSHPLPLTAVGILTMLAILSMEMRNIGRIGIVVERARELEFTLSLPFGQFGKISEASGFGFITYTASLMVIYVAILTMWIYLFVLNSIALYERNFP